MRSLRARIGVCAIALLVCQGAALLAAPAVVCRMQMAGGTDDDDECSQHLGPGETCPMHHKPGKAPDRREPAWKCVCSPADTALLSLFGVAGTLPSPVLVAQSGVRLERIASLSSSSPDDWSQPPRAPPPRA
jgi:hypothetical protein